MVTIDQTVGLVAHLRLTAILKGEQGTYFELVRVGLYQAAAAAESLHELTTLDLSAAFTIATPGGSPFPPVESPDGGDATHGTAASPPSTIALDDAERGVIQAAADAGWFDKATPTTARNAPESADDTPTTARNVPEMPATLDELRAEFNTWTEPDRLAVAAFMTMHDVDTTDPEAVAEAMAAVRNFHDAVAAPVTRQTPDTTDRTSPTLPTGTPDEGPDIVLQSSIDILEAAYHNLDDAGRTFVNDVGAQARAAGLGFHMNLDTGGRRTVRRWEIMRGLIALADGFDNDDAIRGCAAAVNAEVADLMSFNWGHIVGHMGADDAATFANIAVALANGEASMRFTPKARVEAGL